MVVMKGLLFWIALPFLIPQALYVRKHAPRFDPAAGPNEGSVGEGPPTTLLAIGDSIIAGVGASQLSKALVGQTATALAATTGCELRWQAIGTSGFDSRKVLDQLLPRIPDCSFDYIIVSVGVNDVTGLTSVRTWRRNLSQLLGTLRAYSPNAVITVAGLPPMHEFPLLPQPLRAVIGLRARTLDDVARRVVDSLDSCIHVAVDFDPDPELFAADGYHPSEAGYAEFGREVARRMLNPGDANSRSLPKSPS